MKDHAKNYFNKLFTPILFLDVVISLIATYFAHSLRLEGYHIPLKEDFYTYILCVIIFIPVYAYYGIYESIIKYTNLYSIRRIFIATFTYGFLLLILFSLIKELKEIDIFWIYFMNINIPRSIAIIQPIIFCFIFCLIRIVISIQSDRNLKLETPNLVIYGAGIAGAQLLDLIQKNNMYRVIGFIDDDPLKYHKLISGIKIYSEHNLPELINKKNVSNIIIAIPSLEISYRRKLVKKLKKFNIETKILPDIQDLMNNNISINDVRSLNIDDLLEREIDKKYHTTKDLVKNKKVLISGAGGSIGSELCKQIIQQNPSEIILVDHSEYNLYRIKEDLEKIQHIYNTQNIKITPELISINNYRGLRFLFRDKLPNIVFHAAAYKHVNLVEINIFESIRNNYFGTLNIVKLSKEFNVDNFILISSDKAVRPTNVMGATKRLSEMAVQAYADYEKNSANQTIFSIVRFGNVLASSGSVINKFYEQIKNREPLTVTHPEVTRYFMTIYESVHLILQTFKMSKGGEVFLLDMGKPVKIIDIAEKMARLSGLTLISDDNPDGDIKINIIGLRPGEKLYEELLINEESMPSKNDNIFYAKEEFIKLDKLNDMSIELEKNMNQFNFINTIKILEQYVSGFKYTNS
tara:strand:- start:3619 stop:5523 length:1905 start_codon:yes stop_codon:yes gene_type:complete